MSWARQYTVGEAVKVLYGDFEGREGTVKFITESGDGMLVRFSHREDQVYWDETHIMHRYRHKRPISPIFYSLQT